jgi:hypothetical protein
MTMMWSSKIERMASKARMSIEREAGREASVFASVLAITGCVIAPIIMLICFAIDGYFFPRPLYEMNKLVVCAYPCIPGLLCVVGFLELSEEGVRVRRSWESIVRQIWLFLTISGISLGAYFLWLAVAGAWKPIIEDRGGEAFKNFIGLYMISAGTSLFPILGRIVVLAKELARKEKRLACGSLVVFCFVLLGVGGCVFWNNVYLLSVDRRL